MDARVSAISHLPSPISCFIVIRIKTSSGDWDRFCRQIVGFLEADVIDLLIDGAPVRGFRSPDTPALWLRDHSDMLRTGRLIEPDVRSAVRCFADVQSVNGRLFDYVTTFPEKKPCERENWEKWVRVPVEADVEYRFVKAVYLAWQATGDDEWMAGLLPSCERALTYTTTHPWRWDQEHGLVKRPYTIDTWDFDYTAGGHEWLNFQITPHTFWGIMHGDNSGLYEAAVLLGQLYDAAGESAPAERWAEAAEQLRDRANRLLFNGRFYSHFYKLTPVKVDGVDEAEQLSLSNPMAINRGLATPEIATSILNEYRERRARGGAFAEWFSIDPPFPDGIFGDDKLQAGAYVNGGIMPLVGGELARAAFSHGFEQYGIETLNQYRRMIGETGETYLWYFPDGRVSTAETSTSPEATPTDGWGSSAMLNAFLEGLCGIEDLAHSYRRVRLAPRWAATDEAEAEVEVRYAASGAGFSYTYRRDKQRIRLELAAAASEVSLHLLLPDAGRLQEVLLDDEPLRFETSRVGSSRYVDAQITLSGRAALEVTFGDD